MVRVWVVLYLSAFLSGFGRLILLYVAQRQNIRNREILARLLKITRVHVHVVCDIIYCQHWAVGGCTDWIKCANCMSKGVEKVNIPVTGYCKSGWDRASCKNDEMERQRMKRQSVFFKAQTSDSISSSNMISSTRHIWMRLATNCKIPFQKRSHRHCCHHCQSLARQT